MQLDIECDDVHEVWTLYPRGRLSTSDDVTQWRTQLVRLLERKLAGDKGYLLVNLDEFEIEPSVADEYGKVAAEVAERFAYALVRYGQRRGFTSAAVRTGDSSSTRMQAHVGPRLSYAPKPFSADPVIARFRNVGAARGGSQAVRPLLVYSLVGIETAAPAP